MISLEQAIDQIKKVNPFFGELLMSEEPLLDFCREKISRHEFASIHLERQKPYVARIKEKIEKLFDGEGLKVNHEGGMIIDTTDHHGIINFPSTLGAHVMSRFDTLLERKVLGDYYVLDCGNVPLSDSIQKRGVNLGGKHINLYPKKDRRKLVSRYPLYEYDFLESARKSGHKFNKEEQVFLSNLQQIFDKTDFSTCEKLSDQIVKINYQLWQEFFEGELVNDARRCVMLEHDEILIDYLSNFLLSDKKNFIWKSLFDDDFRKVVLAEFNGIYGTWNYSGQGSGTYFFWGFNEDDGKNYPMMLEGRKLVSAEKRVRDVELVPEDVAKALREGILIPAIFLKFGLVGSYLGAKMMGGPGQTEYAGKLHEAWLRVFKKVGDKEEFALAKKVNLNNFIGGDLFFTKDKDGNIVRDWGLDVAMNHRMSKWYLEKLKQVELRYLLYPLIPISYYRLTPAKERQKINYTDNDLYKGFSWVK